MIKKTKLPFVLILLCAVLALIVVILFQRQQQRVLMEMFYSVAGADARMELYHFVVQNDGTFRSSQGIPLFPSILVEGRIWRIPIRKATTTLSDYEFQNILDLLAEIARDYEEETWRTIGEWWDVTILYDGNVYDRSSTCTFLLGTLIYEMRQLSPLD